METTLERPAPSTPPKSISVAEFRSTDPEFQDLILNLINITS